MLIHLFLLIIPTLILCQTVINIQSKDFCPSKTSKPKTRIPRLQIRSVLVRCPNRGEFHVIKAGGDDRTNLSVGRTQDLLEFFGYDSDEPLLHSEVTSCRRKLVVTIQITNCGKTKTEEEFILIDQVYDPVWKQRIRLLNPVVFKIKQQQVEQSFGLIIQHIVNAEATENVINKNNKSFKGCSTSGLRPTCGYSYYHDEVIPYSEGFCCSCDPYVNVLRQPETLRIPPLSPIAFTTREGQFPQGRRNRKKEKIVMKRKTERTLRDSIDEIYENFASKIKSYMYPAHRRVSELKPNEHMMEVRPHRSLFRLSPKYYKIPPLNPAKGFRATDIQIETKPDIDPWSIPLTLNESQKEKLKNAKCLSFNRILSKYSPEKRIIRSWEWEPEVLDALLEPGLLDELFESELFSNISFLGLLRNLLLPNEKRSIFTHYLDPGNAESQLLAQPLKVPLDEEEYNAMEHFVNAIKKLNNSEWVQQIVNPYRDSGVLCGPNYKKLFKQLARKPVKKLNESDWVNRFINPYSDPGVICSPNYTHIFVDQTTSTMSKGRQKNKHLKNPRKYFKKRLSKRQITSSGTQVRGGQSCLDRHVPMNANPETYHESAHCLTFSELWYNVYRLKTPFITHTTNFQLFDKNTFEAGLNHWEDLTKGMRIQLGTFNRHTVDHKHDPTLVFTYTPLTDILKEQFCLDPLITTLLVPRPVAKDKIQNFPQILGGPPEYLLVRAQDVSYDGEDCDKAGIGFKAFAKQPARCDNLRGTCLSNQPIHLWKYDIDARKNGKPGKYFLENYAKVSEEPIKFHKEVGDFLSLDFTGSYQSVVEVEVPIDRNGLVRADSTAQLSEIYIDATCEHQTRITVLVTNIGLTSSAFYPRMKGCPPEIPQVWTENEGPLVYIAPQKVHKYRLSLYGMLPVTRFHCSIELMNKNKQLVATRRIRIQNYDRCICMWHCLCACIGSISGLKCDHMSLEHYHAAGFSGALPVDTEDPAYERLESALSPFIFKDFVLYVLYVYLIFLIMGLLKFLLGLLFVTVANYGMWLLFEYEAKHMTKYKESFWALTHLVRDSECFPVSPAGRSRQIQILSKPAQAFVNIFFFCIFPGIVLLKLPCAFCNVCCVSFALLKMELLKTEWIRTCCAQPCCVVFSRCIRRTKRTFKRNFWLPLCCFLNPFFLYSLCRSKSKEECNENKGEKTNKVRRCKIHRQPKKDDNEGKDDATTVQYLKHMFPSQYGDKAEVELLLPSQIDQSRNKHNMMNNIPFSVDRDSPKNYEELFTNVSYVVKTSDYPNLDKKSIKYIVKNVKKSFNNVVNQVIKVYKAQKHKQDTHTLINEVEEMRNKMMKNVISNISKTAIREILHKKYGMIEKNAAYERAEVKPIAEQVMVLIDRCFQEIVKRKTDGAKLSKL